MYSILLRRLNLSDIRIAALMLLSAVLVACGGGSSSSTPAPVVHTYTVGGSVTGLAGSGLVLQDGAGHNLAISADGAFTFPAIASGTAYAVDVNTSPVSPAQVCTVTNGTGSVASANVTNVLVVCSTSSQTVGGTVTGLTGSGLVLENNGESLPVTGATFTFLTSVASGATYAVTVQTQPSNPTQDCQVTANGTGTITTADVTNVAVVCTTNSYTVGGNVTGLTGTGTGLVLNNGSENLSIPGNGAFTFITSVASGAAYSVTVLTPPSSGPVQICTVTNGSGTVGGANVTNVSVVCTTNTYTVGGTVTGLTGSGLVLHNGTENLPVSVSPFTFTTPVASGATYAVTVSTQPGTPTQHCTVSSGTGTVTNAAIIGVTVVCRTTGSLVLVTNPFDGNGSISVLAIDSDSGALSTLVKSDVLLGDQSPIGITVDSSAARAYVANQDSADLTAYDIAVGGALTAVLAGVPTSATTTPFSLAQNSAGTHFYVGSDRVTLDGIIDAYAAGGASGVTPIVDAGNTPYVSGNTPKGLAIDPNDDLLFATNQFDGIASFQISADGKLSNRVTTVFHAGDPINNPYGVAVHPSSNLIFVTDLTVGKLSVYNYDTLGNLTVNGSPYTVGSAPKGVAVDPTGQFVYVANSGGDTVSGFKINATTGVLTSVGPAVAVKASGPAQTPTALGVEPSGQFLYVVNDAGSVSAFTIDSTTGVLTLIVGSPVATAGAGGRGTASLAIH